jgi:RNA polymerase sigma-70 factor (ECF subfamily)
MDERACKLTELVQQHYALLYRYAYRLTGSEPDAEDLTQQAFLTAQLKLEQLRDECCARAWLIKIVRNAFLRNRRAPVCLTLCELDSVPAIESATTVDLDFDAEQLQSALNDLPEEFRSALILFYFREFTYREIAELMGTPIGTVMSRLARGKAYLRQQLTAHELVGATLGVSEVRTP